MKKIWLKNMALALSGMLLLGGCGADQTEQAPLVATDVAQDIQSEENAPQTVEADADQTTETESQSEESTPAETADSGIPTIAVTQERKEWYTDDGEVLLLEAEASRVEVVGDGFDALKASLATQWKGLGGDYDEMLEWATDHYNSLKDTENFYFPSYSVSESVGIRRMDEQVISFCDSVYEYTGGAHGMFGNTGKTFDVESGEELQIEDLLSDPEGFYDKALEYILDELEENYGEELFQGYEETVRNDTFGETPQSWYLDDTGIVIDYAVYLIAPYAAGMPSVTLPYDEFASYIKEDYLKPRGSLIAGVEVNKDFSELIGEIGEVMLTAAYPDEFSDAEVSVVSGNARETVGTFGRVANAYVIKRGDGRSFLVFCCDYASDDFVTYVYEVTGGAVRACDKLDGAAWSGTCVGTDRIGLSMHLDVLGTYSGEMVYQLTAEGKLVPTEEIFAVNTSQKLTVVRELPVIMEGEATTIPVGSKIRITGTDNAGNAYFQLDTGETGVIQYVRDDAVWQILIDGVSENEYFEMVPYAG